MAVSFFKNGPFPASFFFIFVFFNTIQYKFCQWRDSSLGHPVSEATSLPTAHFGCKLWTKAFLNKPLGFSIFGVHFCQQWSAVWTLQSLVFYRSFIYIKKIYKKRLDMIGNRTKVHSTQGDQIGLFLIVLWGKFSFKIFRLFRKSFTSV